ncbi:hypothetical protein KIN20_002882, partial [Parelaphostrongylus tenuis]
MMNNYHSACNLYSDCCLLTKHPETGKNKRPVATPLANAQVRSVSPEAYKLASHHQLKITQTQVLRNLISFVWRKLKWFNSSQSSHIVDGIQSKIFIAFSMSDMQQK